MTRDVLALMPDESIDGVPLGLISVDDLIRELSLELGSIASIIARQSQRPEV